MSLALRNARACMQVLGCHNHSINRERPERDMLCCFSPKADDGAAFDGHLVPAGDTSTHGHEARRTSIAADRSSRGKKDRSVRGGADTSASGQKVKHDVAKARRSTTDTASEVSWHGSSAALHALRHSATAISGSNLMMLNTTILQQQMVSEVEGTT